MNKMQEWLQKTATGVMFVMIPVAGLYIVNLPYSAIRSPIAEKAPLLLLPSQIVVENNFKEAVNLVEQSDQLINNSTSFADFDQGTEKLAEGKIHLNKIPLIAESELMGYTNGWYSRYFSPNEFQRMRRLVGQLEAKVFQEKNAQIALSDIESQLNQVKSQYQQSSNEAEKQELIKSWRENINNLRLISTATLAGNNAQTKLINYEEEFEEISGLRANNSKTNTFINTAEEFANIAQARMEGAPHDSETWSEIEEFWQLAINELENINSSDLEGYSQAIPILAQYKQNLRQVQRNQKIESESKDLLANAENLINDFVANTPEEISRDNINQRIAEIQRIINELDKVESGTTSYSEAITLKSFSENKLKELKQLF